MVAGHLNASNAQPVASCAASGSKDTHLSVEQIKDHAKKIHRAYELLKKHQVPKHKLYTHYVADRELPLGSVCFPTEEETKKLYDTIVGFHEKGLRQIHVQERVTHRFKLFFTVSVKGPPPGTPTPLNWRENFFKIELPFLRVICKVIREIFPEENLLMLICVTVPEGSKRDCNDIKLRFNCHKVIINEKRANIVRRKIIHALRHDSEAEKVQEQMCGVHVDNTWESILRMHKTFLRLPFCDRADGERMPYVPGGVIEINEEGVGAWKKKVGTLTPVQLLKVASVAVLDDKPLTKFSLSEEEEDHPELCKAKTPQVLADEKRLSKKARQRTTDGSYA